MTPTGATFTDMVDLFVIVNPDMKAPPNPSPRNVSPERPSSGKTANRRIRSSNSIGAFNGRTAKLISGGPVDPLCRWTMAAV
jgi:hypothetical protein